MINFNKDAAIQAEFSLVSNLGSMIPRYIYAPIEEVGYNVFAKLNDKSRGADGLDE